jgi:hypothetical protein
MDRIPIVPQNHMIVSTHMWQRPIPELEIMKEYIKAQSGWEFFLHLCMYSRSPTCTQ